MKRIWNKTDPIYVGLWKQLIHWGCEQAAVGLICDVFTDLMSADEFATASEDHRSGVDDMRSNLREVAMSILSDDDGSTLKDWMRAFRTDRAEFAEIAAEFVASKRMQ